jgi:acyl carrier protein
VVHAAGVLADGIIVEQGEAELRRVLAAKAEGAQHLAEALRASTSAAWLCLVSSVAGVTGAPGQGGYGAANAYLDGLAHALRQRGALAQSIALGPLSGGMASGGARAAVALGLAALDVELAASALADAIGTAPTGLLLAGAVDAEAAHAAMTPALSQLTSEWLAAPRTARPPALLAELQQTGVDRQAFVRDWLKQRVAEALHVEVNEVPSGRGLLELGLDSLMMLQLRGRLEQAFGLRLEPAALFSHPTIERLAEHVQSRLGRTSTTKERAPIPAAKQLMASDSDFLSALEAMDENQAIRLNEEMGR